MTDYISKKGIQKDLIDLPADLDAKTVQRCIEVVHNFPAADVRANIHGKWIVIIEKDVDGNGYYNCSVCGAGESHVPSNTVSYCWNCGARMDGGDEQ